MKKELQQQFYARWPSWFSGRNEPITQNLMPFGFEHGDGWFDLEWRLCEALEQVVPVDYKLFQIKEKFGTLRWYDNGNTDEGDALISQAEKESALTCELCGLPGILRGKNGLTTQCDTCFNRPQ